MADELDPKSEAHVNKRDRKHASRSKALMRTGLSKTFHTLNEIRRRRAEEAAARQVKEKSTPRKRKDS